MYHMYQPPLPTPHPFSRYRGPQPPHGSSRRRDQFGGHAPAQAAEGAAPGTWMEKVSFFMGNLGFS